MNDQDQPQQWQQWHLTAYALGELEPEQEALIAEAAAGDPQLASEIAEIQSVLGQVRSVYQAEPSCGLEAAQREAILAQPHDASGVVGPAVSAGGSAGALRRWRSRLVWSSLIGTAAALFLVIYFANPQIRQTAYDGVPAERTLDELESDLRQSALDESTSIDSGYVAADANRSQTAADVEQHRQESSGGESGRSSDRQGPASLAGSASTSHMQFDQSQVLSSAPGPSAAAADDAPVSDALASGDTSVSSPSSGPASERSSADVAENLPGGLALPSVSESLRPTSSSAPQTSSQPGDSNVKKALTRKRGSASKRSLSEGYDLGLQLKQQAEPSTAAPAAQLPASELGFKAEKEYRAGGAARGGYGGEGGGYGGEGGAGMGGGYGGVGGPGRGAGAMYGGAMAGGGDSGMGGMDGYGLTVKDRDASSTASRAKRRGQEVEQSTRLSLATNLHKNRRLADGGRSEFGVRLQEQIVPKASSFGYQGGDRFDAIYENRFERVDASPLSTFSIDVDTASYAKCRQLLLEGNSLPPAGAVRLEEFINYFDYEYAGPDGEDPFASNLLVADCPWRPAHKLVRIALQAKKMEVTQRPKANIVFLLDVSGSMDQPNKLPLVKESMRMLVRQLGENDRVAMAVYAGAAGCVLEGTTGDQQREILDAIERLNAGGSTNGGQGIQLAYNLARDNFVPSGINRVILCTDGDFNVGVTNTQSLVDLVAENAKSKIFLTVLGFGMGNTNDAMMEQVSNRGNGVYGFVDSRHEAHRQMVRQLAGNLITVAKDVKIQVEFNPHTVASYRLLGYENRVMAAEDFNDDQKDAGEIGVGHRVTALYEIVPVGVDSDAARPPVDDLKYQKTTVDSGSNEPAQQIAAPIPDKPFRSELLTVKLRYKQPEGDTSKLLEFPLENSSKQFAEADRDFRWAASMAQFGMLLRGSRFAGDSSWSDLVEQAKSAAGISPDASRQECLEMIHQAAKYSGR